MNNELNSEQLLECIECSRDIIRFTKHCKIMSDNDLVSFIPRSYQEKILNTLTNSKNVVINASRQSGKTYTVLTYLLSEAIFKTDNKILIITNTQEQSRYIITKIQSMISSLPDYFKDIFEKSDGNHIIAKNGMSISVIPITITEHYDLTSFGYIYFDEFAFIDENLVENLMYTNFKKLVNSETKMILASTPNHNNNFFKILQIALDNPSNFDIIKVTWKDVDEKGIKNKLTNVFPIKSFNQEYECSFT